MNGVAVVSSACSGLGCAPARMPQLAETGACEMARTSALGMASFVRDGEIWSGVRNGALACPLWPWHGLEHQLVGCPHHFGTGPACIQRLDTRGSTVATQMLRDKMLSSPTVTIIVFTFSDATQLLPLCHIKNAKPDWLFRPAVGVEHRCSVCRSRRVSEITTMQPSKPCRRHQPLPFAEWHALRKCLVPRRSGRASASQNFSMPDSWSL